MAPLTTFLCSVRLVGISAKAGRSYAFLHSGLGVRHSRLLLQRDLEGVGSVGLSIINISLWSDVFSSSRYFIGFKSMLASRMILRLRWYFSPRCSLQVTDGSTTLHAGAVTDTGIIFAAPEEAITRTFSWDTTDTRRPSPSTNSIALQRIA